MRGASIALAVLACWPREARADEASAPAAFPDGEVVVRGSHRSHDATAITVLAHDGQELAGTEGDPVKAVQDLPGVARPSFGSGELVVWGSSPRDTRTYVDGVEIPALFHGASLRSTLSGDLVHDVTFTPGAYGVDYGRGLGGTVRVETRDLPDIGVHGYVGADTLDGSSMVSAALSNRVRVAIAARHGWIDNVLRAVNAPNVDAFFAVPRYDDVQAKAQVDLRAGEKLDAVFLASRDDLTETIPDADPSRKRTETTSTAYERFYLRYRRSLEGGSWVEIVPWVGHDGSALDAAFGGTPASLHASTWRAGLRAVHRSRPVSWLAMTIGVDVDNASANVARDGSLEVPPREGDVTVFGEPPGPDVNVDSWNAGVIDVAPYAQFDLEAGPLLVSPGLRADAFLMTTSRQTPRVGETPSIGLSHLDGEIEPRVSVRLRVTPRLSLLGAAGFYSQPPVPTDLSAVFGNPTLGPESAEHATIGESLRLTESLSADVVGFAKSMSDLAVRDPSPNPELGQALLQEGVGRSYGLQLLVRQRPWHGFFGWASYTISRAERRDAPGEAWRLFDYDQPHVLTVVASRAMGPWTVGTRFRLATGLPRTPVIGAFYDAKDNQYDPVFGPQNSIRLPAFWQIDARVDREFALGPELRLRVYLEGLNVSGRSNGEEYVYNTAYAQRGTVAGLPFVAVLGARMDL